MGGSLSKVWDALRLTPPGRGGLEFTTRRRRGDLVCACLFLLPLLKGGPWHSFSLAALAPRGRAMDEQPCLQTVSCVATPNLYCFGPCRQRGAAGGYGVTFEKKKVAIKVSGRRSVGGALVRPAPPHTSKSQSQSESRSCGADNRGGFLRPREVYGGFKQ